MESPDYSDSEESSSCSSEGAGTAKDLPLCPKPTDLGKRVVFLGNDKRQKFGVLRFVGEAEFAEGVWCGVELDQPTGKNNGSIHGIRYFTCDTNCGMFVPISKLELDTGRRSRSRPNSQPSSRATSVERKEPSSRPGTAKSATKGSVPALTSVNKVGIGELVTRLSQPLRRPAHAATPGNRRQPMKAFATKGIHGKAKEEKKALPPFRSGGMYKAASSENIRGMKDKEKMKGGGQKSQGISSKKSSSERDLRNVGKAAAGGGVAKATDPAINKAKWKQLRTKSSSDILESLPDATTTSNKSSTTSSSSHTSLENYPWPRTSTPGNRDELTPDGCSSPEESHDNITQHSDTTAVNNGFVKTPEGNTAVLPTTKTPPIKPAPTESESTDALSLANHVSRFTAQVSSTPSLTHQSVQAPENGHTHKQYKNRPSGTATLTHPLTSTLVKEGGTKLLKELLGPNQSLAGVTAKDVVHLFQKQEKLWHSVVVDLESKLEQEQAIAQKWQEQVDRLQQLLEAQRHQNLKETGTCKLNLSTTP